MTETKPIYAARTVADLDALLAVFCCEHGILDVSPAPIPFIDLPMPAREWLGAFDLRRAVLVIEEANLAAGRGRWG